MEGYRPEGRIDAMSASSSLSSWPLSSSSSMSSVVSPSVSAALVMAVCALSLMVYSLIAPSLDGLPLVEEVGSVEDMVFDWMRAFAFSLRPVPTCESCAGDRRGGFVAVEMVR